MIDENMIECTGCGACAQKCPKNCIQMKPNEEGFLFPTIDRKLCINCNLCEKACPIYSKTNINSLNPIYFGIINKNYDMIMNSSSGGVFIAFAKYFIDNGGFVSGSVFKEKKIIHILSNKMEDIIKMQGSKYVQSDTTSVYKEIMEKLSAGNCVLFTGTPCQVDGLYTYLGCKHKNLFTIDILCHGVPSQLYLEKCLDYYENKFKFEIENVNFRSKNSKKWGENYGLLLDGKCESKYVPAIKDAYYRDFFDGKAFRECCYKCMYANKHRVSDLTIGDFQGFELIDRKTDSSKGVSVVSINSEKGNTVFNKIKDQFLVINTNYNEVSRINTPLRHCVERPSLRDNVYVSLQKKGYKKIQSRVSIKNCIKNIVPKKIKAFIKCRLKKRRLNNEQ